MKTKTPAEILIAYWEKEYVGDKELQKRYDDAAVTGEHQQKQCVEILPVIEGLQQDMESLKDLIVANACAGHISQSINDEYLKIGKEYNIQVKRYQQLQEEIAKHKKSIEQLENLSYHKKSVMYNMLSALEPNTYNIKPGGINYPKWSEKYKDNIV